jgi:hypothetical protein
MDLPTLVHYYKLLLIVVAVVAVESGGVEGVVVTVVEYRYHSVAYNVRWVLQAIDVDVDVDVVEVVHSIKFNKT